MQTVAVVGVGLIGGSFALALRRAGFEGRIIGVSSPRTVEEALAHKVIDEALPIEQAGPRSDLVYLSQPISRILTTLQSLDEHLKPGALVTDAGSTKAAIVEQARRHIRRGVFLGGHPMAGKESRGPAAAEGDLFEGRPYVLTPAEAGTLDEPAVREFAGWVDRIGARRIVLSPEEHDRVVALASHLPQLVSTALASMLAGSADREAVGKAAGPGLMDMTRLAQSHYDIWADIIDTNGPAINDSLASFLEALSVVRAKLAGGDLRREFEAGGEFAAALREPPEESETP